MQRRADKPQDGNKKSIRPDFLSTFVLLLLLRIRLLNTASCRHPPQACLVNRCVLFVFVFFLSVAAVASGESFALHAKSRLSKKEKKKNPWHGFVLMEMSLYLLFKQWLPQQND